MGFYNRILKSSGSFLILFGLITCLGGYAVFELIEPAGETPSITHLQIYFLTLLLGIITILLGIMFIGINKYLESIHDKELRNNEILENLEKKYNK